jgi:small subunit ribosomal protein S8
MDPIADLLTRIRNGISARQDKIDVPHSRVKEGMAEVLKKLGFISNFRVVRDNKQGVMRVYLRYDSSGKAMLSHLKRESRPGLRKYVKAKDIPVVRTGFGAAIISTSQGIMSGDEAKEKQVGGEFLCSVW